MSPDRIDRVTLHRTALVAELLRVKREIEARCPAGRQRALALTALESVLIHTAASLEGVETLFDLKEVQS